MSSLSTPTKHVFHCPICGSRGDQAVAVQRPNGTWVDLNPLRQCTSCSVVFGDPARFTLYGHRGNKSLAEDIQRNNRITGDY